MTQTDPSETSKINQVTIYYDLNNDLFGVVNEKTNTFVTWSVALLFDYIDIFYFSNRQKVFSYIKSQKVRVL